MESNRIYVNRDDPLFMGKTKEKKVSEKVLSSYSFPRVDKERLANMARIRGQSETQILRDLINGGTRLSPEAETWIDVKTQEMGKSRLEVIEAVILAMARQRG